MSTIFRLDASIRSEGSVTRAVGTTLESALIANLEDASVVRRDVGLAPPPSTSWGPAALAAWTPRDKWTSDQESAVALAVEYADELVNADAYIFAIPFYNYGVSQHVKAWIDMVLTDPRFAPGAEQLLAGRPAFLVIARGGGYGPGTPRHGWDQATPWLVQIFRDVWGLELTVIEAELTLADSVPAMASLRDIAAQSLENAHSAAAEHGRLLADRLSAQLAVPA